MLKRLIYEDIFEDKNVGKLSDRAFRIYIAMIVGADDGGRISAEPRIIRNRVFQWSDVTNIKEIESYLSEIFDANLMQSYIAGNERYATHPPSEWKKRQILKKIPFKKHPIPNLFSSSSQNAKFAVVPVKRQNSEVNTILFGTIPQLTGRVPPMNKMARNHIHSFLKEIHKKFPKGNPVGTIEMIIKAALSFKDGWHTAKCHEPYHLRRYWQEIIVKYQNENPSSTRNSPFQS